jgi:hypothetical protein
MPKAAHKKSNRLVHRPGISGSKKVAAKKKAK